MSVGSVDTNAELYVNPLKYFSALHSLVRRETASAAAIGGRGISSSTVRIMSPYDGPAATMMEMSAVFRCVQLISNSIASMSVHRECLVPQDGIYARVTGDNLDRLLCVAPNGRQSAFDFWRAVVRGALLDGVSYIVPRYAEGGRLHRLDFYRASGTGAVVTYNDLTGIYTAVNAGRMGYPATETLTEDQIIVIRHLSTDGVNCQPMNIYARRAVELAQIAEDETGARVKDGGAPRLILSHTAAGVYGTGAAQEEQLRQVARVVDYEARVNKSRIISTPAGVAATQISATSADLQLQSVREFAVREICRFYGVPPQYLYCDTASNYKSAEMAGIDFMVTTLDPILRSIECELNRKLAAPGERFVFDRTERTAADLTTRARYLSTMLGTGAYTVNDIRRMSDLPPVEGGDTPLVTANVRTITDIVNQSHKQNAPDK